MFCAITNLNCSAFIHHRDQSLSDIKQWLSVCSVNHRVNGVVQLLHMLLFTHLECPADQSRGNWSSRSPSELKQEKEELTSAEWGYYYQTLIGGVACTQKPCHRNADLSPPGEAGPSAPAQELRRPEWVTGCFSQTSVRCQDSSSRGGNEEREREGVTIRKCVFIKFD